MYYFLSFGTNIYPEQSAVTMVRKVSEQFSRIALYPFQFTEAEGVEIDETFLNTVLVIFSEASAIEVKHQLNRIEESMGRDRSDPDRRTKSRAADLDILGCSPSLDFMPFKSAKEGYVKTCFNIAGEGVDLSEHGLAPYQGPASIHIDALTGQVVVIDDELDGFVNWVESTFSCH